MEHICLYCLYWLCADRSFYGIFVCVKVLEKDTSGDDKTSAIETKVRESKEDEVKEDSKLDVAVSTSADERVIKTGFSTIKKLFTIPEGNRLSFGSTTL